MIEELIKNSVLLSDERKKILLERVKKATPEYIRKIEKLLREEGDLIALLFRKYQEQSGEDVLATLKGTQSSFEIQKIREQERQEQCEDTTILLDF